MVNGKLHRVTLQSAREEEEGEGEGAGAGAAGSAGATGEQESRREGEEGVQEDGRVTVRGRGERIQASVSVTMDIPATPSEPIS